MGIDEIREVDALANRLRAKMHGKKIAGFTIYNNPVRGADKWRARAWIDGKMCHVYIGRDVTAAREKILGWLSAHPEAAKLLEERLQEKK